MGVPRCRLPGRFYAAKWTTILCGIFLTSLLLVFTTSVSDKNRTQSIATFYEKQLRYYNRKVNIGMDTLKHLDEHTGITVELLKQKPKRTLDGNDKRESSAANNWFHTPVENKWQSVTRNGDFIVYSAYFGQDTHSKQTKVVRVIGLFDDGCSAKKVDCPIGDEVSCIFLYRDADFRLVTASDFKIYPDHHFTRFKPFTITCALPDDILPEQVSVVNLKRPEFPPLNNVTISYSSLNTNPSRRFTMCLSPLHGETVSEAELVQYIELNADYFLIYTGHDFQSNRSSALEHYRSQGIVEFVPWELHPLLREINAVWYYAQMSMLNDCVFRNKGLSKYVITTDLDEFIIPRKHTNWSELLSAQPEACEYQIRSVVMVKGNASKTINGKAHVPNNSKCLEEIGQGKQSLCSLCKQYRRNYIYGYNDRSKYIINPECMFIAGVHFNHVVIPTKSSSLKVVYVPVSTALVNHYMNESRLPATVG
ncbi:hypothetical protein DPMN_030679 [Dreissena polymorpha]|uniref:Glycosyltransferase family 92 protein n=1 Tax=Dreissena polymorpha TaxID=45954 RepID=A0A9D4LYK9_DREPO|nr:hypothetical protein DPMN_030679 [Dreissena polymorpha]